MWYGMVRYKHSWAGNDCCDQHYYLWPPIHPSPGPPAPAPASGATIHTPSPLLPYNQFKSRFYGAVSLTRIETTLFFLGQNLRRFCQTKQLKHLEVQDRPDTDQLFSPCHLPATHRQVLAKGQYQQWSQQKTQMDKIRKPQKFGKFAVSAPKTCGERPPLVKYIAVSQLFPICILIRLLTQLCLFKFSISVCNLVFL